MISTKEDHPNVGVVVLNYNSPDDTVSLVRGLFEYQSGISLKVVVVDNNSTDNSVEIIRSEISKYNNAEFVLSRNNIGYSAGNNLGLKSLIASGSEYLAVINSDIIIRDPYMLRKLCLNLDKSNNGAFISPLILTNGVLNDDKAAWRLPTHISEIFKSGYLLKLLGAPYLKCLRYNIGKQADYLVDVECVPGSFFLGRSDTFAEMDFLDENTFLFYEEIILGQKVRAKELVNYIDKSSICDHMQGGSINRVMNFKEKHQHQLNSKKYYWKTYRASGNFFLALLEFLEKLRRIEYTILSSLRIIHK